MGRVTFYLKHFETITASLLNVFVGLQRAASGLNTVITDFNVGSVNRTLLEAVAMEIEEQYYRVFDALQAAIPESLYEAFGFAKLAATSAVGSVTFSRSTAAPANYDIPAGTLVATADGIAFSTTVDATLAQATTSVTVGVTAARAGAAGNVAAGSITTLQQAVLGVETVTNAAATSGGTDEETDDAQQARFTLFVSELARAPRGGITAGAKTATITDATTGQVIEQVTKVEIIEGYLDDPSQPLGTVRVYIDNGTGTASAALVTACQQVLAGYTDADGNPVIGYKAAGTTVTVLAATAVPVNVHVTSLTMALNAVFTDVKTALTTAAQQVFSTLNIGAALDYNTLLAALMGATGVVTLTLPTPTGNIAGVSGQRLVLGTMTVDQP